MVNHLDYVDNWTEKDHAFNVITILPEPLNAVLYAVSRDTHNADSRKVREDKNKHGARGDARQRNDKTSVAVARTKITKWEQSKYK